MRLWAKRWIPLLLCGILCGCASLGLDQKPLHRGDTGFERELTGRISVHYQSLSTDHQETVFANFDWSEHGSKVDLDLLNPLGQTIARVRAAPEMTTLTLNDGRVYSGVTPEALTEQVLGWTLPVEGLRAWLEGRPLHPEAAATSIDADGSHRLVEDGWTIVYTLEAGDPAPRRLNLSYPGPGVALEMRIVVDSRSGA